MATTKAKTATINKNTTTKKVVKKVVKKEKVLSESTLIKNGRSEKTLEIFAQVTAEKERGSKHYVGMRKSGAIRKGLEGKYSLEFLKDALEVQNKGKSFKKFFKKIDGFFASYDALEKKANGAIPKNVKAGTFYNDLGVEYKELSDKVITFVTSEKMVTVNSRAVVSLICKQAKKKVSDIA